MPADAVSVIIPTYNRAHLVRRAVASALAQVGPDDEIIVADDGSRDATADILSPFFDKIRYLPRPHYGAGTARNQAVVAATKPLLAFLDSDDEWYGGKLALQRAFMAKRPDVVFCFSDFCSMLSDGTEEHRYLSHWHNDPRPWDEILGPGQRYSEVAPLPKDWEDFRVHVGSLYLPEMESDYVASSTVMVRRSPQTDKIQFAEDLGISEDKEYFSRLTRLGPAAYLDCETAWQHGHSAPRLTNANAFAFACARIVLLKRIWGGDPEFCARYGDRLQRALNGLYLRRARWLMVRGRMAEAREDLRLAQPCPWSYRLLAALPKPIVKGLLHIRRHLVRTADYAH